MKPSDQIDLYYTIRQIKYRYQLDKFEDSSLKEIMKSVDKAKSEILVDLESKFSDNVLSDKEIMSELDQLTAGIKQQLGQDVSDVASMSYEQSIAAHNSIMSIGGRAANVSVVQLSGDQINSFLETPMGGMHLNDWVNRTFDYPLQEKLKQELGAGLFRGESYKKLSGRIEDLMGEASDNVDTLVRSWVQKSNVDAQQAVYKANEDLIKGWRWDATMENGNFANGHGTCLRCLSLDADDTIYPLDGGPSIPLHPNCRCQRRVITKSYRELGIPIDDLEDATRPYTVRGKVDPLTGQIKRGKTGLGGQPLLDAGKIDGGYDAFFAQLPDQVQRQTLGPGRYQLWKEGKIKLGDLADSKGKQKTIEQLKGR